MIPDLLKYSALKLCLSYYLAEKCATRERDYRMDEN